MRFHIREIVLWPRDPNIPPKRVPFATDALNVISGVSRTGKSAVIPIIDYCLGAEACTIPVRTIRDRCSWFGIIVSTEVGEKLLARREPGAQRSTSDMYVAEGPTIEPPTAIAAKNTTVEAVKRSLDELAGLTLLDFDPDRPGSGFKGRPSFRDMVSFTFQPQNIIANQNVLFFKADTHEHREKLRTIFPYVLGAVTPETLARQHELAQLRRDLLRKERDLSAMQALSERLVAEIKAWDSEARELGLISSAPPENAPVTTLLDRLQATVAGSSRELHATEESISAGVQELVTLQREESERAVAVAQLRRRLAEMDRLRDSSMQFEGQLHVQRDRLQLAQWISELQTGERACPICGQGLAGEHAGVHALLTALKDVERSAGDFKGVPAAFDRELQQVRDELRSATEQLNGVRHRIGVLARASEDARARQDATHGAARFIGRLEKALEYYERVGTDGDLRATVEELRERVRGLEAQIREDDVRRRTDLALRRVSKSAELLMPGLDAERPADPLSLIIEDLTVRVAGNDREDYLWEIGSGSNWLSYHLAVTLGLQQFFLSLTRCPVPSFLVFDQPSQVYFPRRLADRRESDAVDVEPAFRDEDVEAVRKAFLVLASVVKTSQGKIQVIVLDHATDSVWGNIKPLFRAADWRDGRKLVPEDWPGLGSA